MLIGTAVVGATTMIFSIIMALTEGLRFDEDAATHLAACRELAARGFRPAAVSAVERELGGRLVAASVWHHPVMAEKARDELALRQGLRRGRPAPVGTGGRRLAAAPPHPRPATANLPHPPPAGSGRRPRGTGAAVDAETDVSAKGAVAVLGEFPADRLVVDVHDELAAKARRRTADHPDSGLHAAADWLLRQWRHPGRRSRGIDRRLTAAKVEDRRWFVTRVGHTLAVVAGPVEFSWVRPGRSRSGFNRKQSHRRASPRSSPSRPGR